MSAGGLVAPEVVVVVDHLGTLMRSLLGGDGLCLSWRHWHGSRVGLHVWRCEGQPLRRWVASVDERRKGHTCAKRGVGQMTEYSGAHSDSPEFDARRMNRV